MRKVNPRDLKVGDVYILDLGSKSLRVVCEIDSDMRFMYLSDMDVMHNLDPRVNYEYERGSRCD